MKKPKMVLTMQTQFTCLISEHENLRMHDASAS